MKKDRLREILENLWKEIIDDGYGSHQFECLSPEKEVIDQAIKEIKEAGYVRKEDLVLDEQELLNIMPPRIKYRRFAHTIAQHAKEIIKESQ